MITCLLIPHLSLRALFETQPGTHDRLVVIHRGGVVDAARKARLSGVVAGMAATRAQSLFPSACLALRDVARERRYSEKVAAALYKCTPRIAVATPDRLFAADVSTAELRPFVYAQGLKAGVGATRNEALLVALRAASGYLLAPDVRAEADFWSRYPAGLLASLFGRDIMERLDLLGFSTLAALRRLTLRHLRVQFGSEGERLYRLLHPPLYEPPIPLFRPPACIAASCDFDETIPTREALAPAVQLLLGHALAQLGERRFRRLTLEAATRADRHAVPVLLRAPSAGGPYVWRVLSDLLPRVAPVPHDVTRLTLSLEELGAPEGTQGALFKCNALALRAVRQVHLRYPGAMLTACTVPHALLPEERTRFEVIAA